MFLDSILHFALQKYIEQEFTLMLGQSLPQKSAYQNNYLNDFTHNGLCVLDIITEDYIFLPELNRTNLSQSILPFTQKSSINS